METFDELDRAIGTVAFDGEALVARVVTQGRRVQRRRRVGAGVGVVALGALAVVPSTLQSSGDHAGPSDHAPNGTPISPEQASVRLAALLPGPSQPLAATGMHRGDQVLRTFDPDGAGRGMVNLDLERVRALLTPAQISNSCRREARTWRQFNLHHQLPRGDDCTPVRGGWLFESVEPPGRVGAGRTKALDWTAQLVTADGRSISVRATNYVDGHAPTRREPVLDMDQLARLATYPGWFQSVS